MEWILSKRIHVWDIATGAELLDIDSREGDFSSLAFSPDGQTIAAANKRGLIRLWETATGKEATHFEPDSGETLTVAFAPDGRTLASGHSNGTALVWGLRPTDAAKPGAAIDDEERQRLWAALASEDAGEAYRAGWALSEDPTATIAFLGKRLRPISAEQIDRLIADLDADAFDQREAATDQLARLGKQAAPALRRVIKTSASEEVRFRVQRLLGRLETNPKEDPDRLRELRAIGVLERIGNTDARAVLKTIGDGAPEAPLTRQAKKALERVDQRSVTVP